MKRGDIYWADLGGPSGRRPVLIVTRDASIPVLNAVVAAPITTRVRGISGEVPLGRSHGVVEGCVASCDSLVSIPKDRLEPRPCGRLDLEAIVALDRALRYALAIVY